MRSRGWTLALALLMAACGGEGDSAEKVVEPPAADEAPTSAEETVDDSEASTAAGATPQDDTTTTEAPAPTFSSDDAIERYDDWIDKVEDYTQSGFVDGNSTYDQALEIVGALDPSLLDGNAEDVAVGFHNCSAESAVSARQFFEISTVEIEVEYLEQHAIGDRAWALDIRSFVRLEGIPEQVENSTVLVTAEGVGPTITLEERDCELPRTPAADDLVSAAAAALGIALDPTSSVASTGSFGDDPACEDVLEAAAGTFGEGGCFWASANTLALMGRVECGWVFDLEGGGPGTWFGVDGSEWQQLTAEQYTQDFLSAECQ